VSKRRHPKPSCSRQPTGLRTPCFSLMTPEELAFERPTKSGQGHAAGLRPISRCEVIRPCIDRDSFCSWGDDPRMYFWSSFCLVAEIRFCLPGTAKNDMDVNLGVGVGHGGLLFCWVWEVGDVKG